MPVAGPVEYLAGRKSIAGCGPPWIVTLCVTELEVQDSSQMLMKVLDSNASPAALGRFATCLQLSGYVTADSSHQPSASRMQVNCTLNGITTFRTSERKNPRGLFLTKAPRGR